MTLKNNRAPLLCCFQLCAWFHCHMWIQTGVRVRKRLSWVLTSVTLTFDLWPWPFAWTSLLTMVITSENFMMIQWWKHGEKGVTDGQTENTICRAAWSQLKTYHVIKCQHYISSTIWQGSLSVGFCYHCVCISLQWRHNGRNGISNHQSHHCLLNRLFTRISKKTSKLRVTGLCAGNSPGTVNSPHKWPVTWKMFPFDDVII